MKNIYYYLRWVWDKCDKAEVVFITGGVLIVLGLCIGAIVSKAVGGLMLLVGVGLWFGVVIKLFIVDPIRQSYKKYKLEQADTFKQLKKEY